MFLQQESLEILWDMSSSPNFLQITFKHVLFRYFIWVLKYIILEKF